jgi:hypothetical protein
VNLYSWGFEVLTVALEKISVSWDAMPHKLIVRSNALVELAASLFTVCTVRPGFCVFEGTVANECIIKGMKICVAIEIQ